MWVTTRTPAPGGVAPGFHTSRLLSAEAPGVGGSALNGNCAKNPVRPNFPRRSFPRDFRQELNRDWIRPDRTPSRVSRAARARAARNLKDFKAP